MPRPCTVAILGQGYVGLPLAMRAVAVGHDVVGFDPDESRVKALADGDSFVTDVSSEEVRAGAGDRALPADR